MLGGHPFDNPQPWFPPPGLSFFHPSLGASFVPSSYLEELRLSLSYLHIGASSVPSSIRSCRQRLSSSGRAMVHPPRAPTPVSCRPPTCLHVEGQGGGPAPMERLRLSPHAAKRSRPQAVGAWRACGRCWQLFLRCQLQHDGWHPGHSLGLGWTARPLWAASPSHGSKDRWHGRRSISSMRPAGQESFCAASAVCRCTMSARTHVLSSWQPVCIARVARMPL